MNLDGMKRTPGVDYPYHVMSTNPYDPLYCQVLEDYLLEENGNGYRLNRIDYSTGLAFVITELV